MLRLYSSRSVLKCLISRAFLRDINRIFFSIFFFKAEIISLQAVINRLVFRDLFSLNPRTLEIRNFTLSNNDLRSINLFRMYNSPEGTVEFDTNCSSCDKSVDEGRTSGLLKIYSRAVTRVVMMYATV